ncbi:IucA/IucC family protein [Herbaspirillum sp.]|jgi:siderophore synthetase component|uniref:IucA/IucC family protein n=1 Tax=Herbaspirillum TaxID=963 RepID=UPI00258E063E|nr:IucA/IucC family protein [Herbaspirillum sp.]MCP3653872.1 siderophore synthetase [Herbaspirillum sp.]MCP3947195.1 siderophore synthetase [Herbaspirillum sp.]MCP4032567.1 siderophore synthetase [Herbaspirillum sp.]MCP4555829.1 siderophore synthetase [Herbaspirillum sp.]
MRTLNLIQDLGEPQDVHLNRAWHQARQRSLQRTLQALFREKLLQREHLIFDGHYAWLPLWKAQSMLRIEGLHLGVADNCQLHGSIAHYSVGNPVPQALLSSSMLLAKVARAHEDISEASLQRLIMELSNSAENDALCLSYRQHWGLRLRAEFGQQQTNFVAALFRSAHPNPSLLLEQWGTLGHPWHPNYKTKLGLSSAEVMALSPEFEATITLSLAAMHVDVACITGGQDHAEYRQWFATRYPQAWETWTTALQHRGEDVSHWLPLPLHPYQLDRAIPERFAQAVEKRQLLLLPEASLPARPTMSFRTVVPEGSPTKPHMKLPVSLRLTSVERTVSPKSAVMGPRLTRLLRDIITREDGFGGRLAILGEEVGLYYRDPKGNDDVSRHLAVLYRTNPMTQRCKERMPVPVGALFADSPLSGRPLVCDLVSAAWGDDADAAEQFFAAYLDVALPAVLGAYLRYGIAFEAHQQNSFVMVDAQLRPVQMLLRDFGDLRIHAPTLRHSSLALETYSSKHTLFEDNDSVRDKFLHAFMLCHIIELALLLSRTYQQPEAAFMAVLRERLEASFAELKPDTEPQRWQTEYRALLQDDWPAKSFVRMRLSDTSEDVVLRMPNPLLSPA